MTSNAETLAEIARLSGLINRHKLGLPAYDNGPPGYHPPAYSNARGRGAMRARARGSGVPRGRSRGHGRGRGRGAVTQQQAQPGRPRINNVWTPNTTSDQASTAATSSSTTVAAPAHQSVHRKLVINNSSTAKSAIVSPSVPTEQPVASTSAEATTTSKQEPPSEVQEDPEEGEIEQTAEERKNAKINPGREITINGVVFIADATGKKLVRKAAAATSSTVASTSTANLSMVGTPSKTSIGGQSYVRTKSGNLISKDLVKNREMEAKKKRLDQLVGIVKGVQSARGQRIASASKKLQQQHKTLCRYFQKTGVCTRGLTCPYLHDSNKVSICPRYLRNSCPLPSSACPLSHDPNPNRMPHCVHFPYCNKGTECTYSHVHVSPNAKVCRNFVTLGWCEKGLECRERHVWECPEFSEKGTCKRKGCKLPHVIRRRGAAGEDDNTVEEKEKEEMQDGTTMTDVEHSLPIPGGDKGKKRQLESDDEDMDQDVNDSSADEVEGELLNNHKKKQRLEFNPDAVEANADFVTLVISDSDDAEDEDDSEEDDDSSVASDEDEEEGNSAMEDTAATTGGRQASPKGISHVFTVGARKDRFARRGSTAEDDEGQEEEGADDTRSD